MPVPTWGVVGGPRVQAGGLKQQRLHTPEILHGCREGVGQLLRFPAARGESGLLHQQVHREVGYGADVSAGAGLQDALLRGHNVTLGRVPPRGACGRLVLHGARGFAPMAVVEGPPIHGVER